MSVRVAGSAAPHRSDSLRSTGSRPRVTFRRGVDVQPIAYNRQIQPHVHRQPPPPAGSPQRRKEAEHVLSALAAVQCEVSPNERPVDNGLQRQKERQLSGLGSLSRASLRRKKKDRPELTNITTNTISSPAEHRASPGTRSRETGDIEADKNNLIKEENLLRESQGRGNLLHVDGLLKRSSSQVDQLNNLNTLKDKETSVKHSSYFDTDILSPYTSKNTATNLEYLRDSVDHQPAVHNIHIAVDPNTPRRTDSSSQTSPRHKMPRTPGVKSLAASTAALVSTPLVRDASPPPRPQKQASPYKPRGFSYLGRGDADIIEKERADSETSHSRSVAARSQNIIEQIRRDRSWSPDRRPGRRSSPPPELIVPTEYPAWMRSREHEDPPEVERGNYRRDHVTHERNERRDRRSDSSDRYRQRREPSLESKSFQIPPPEIKTSYHTQYGPEITKTIYHEMTPEDKYQRKAPYYDDHSPRRYPNEDSFTSRNVRTYRYDTDSSTSRRHHRDDSGRKSPDTRTYRFSSDNSPSSRAYDSEPIKLTGANDKREVMRKTSSIVMIGVDDPEPETLSSSPRRPGLQRLSTLVEASLPGDEDQPHYQVPRYTQNEPDSERVIRISVSGSHSSDSPMDPRKTHVKKTSTVDRYSASHDRRRHPGSRSHSREPSPGGRRRSSSPPYNGSSESPRRRQESSETEVRSGTMEKSRYRTSRLDESTSSKHRRDKKKNFAIKFMYEDDTEAPSERLARYTEYTGDEEPASSPERERDPKYRRSVEKEGWKTDKFMTSLIEESRPEGSERSDGRRVTPPSRHRDKSREGKPHGVWSSHSEDVVDADYRRSQKVTQSSTSKRTTRDSKKTRSSISSEDGRRHRPKQSRSRDTSRNRDASRDRGHSQEYEPSRGRRDSRDRSSSAHDESRDRRSPVRQTSKDRSSSPEPGKKTNWLSATLSRLDLKSKNKGNRSPEKDEKASDKEPRSPSRNNRTPSKDKERSVSRSGSHTVGYMSGRNTVDRRTRTSSRNYANTGQESSDRRRSGHLRAGSRDSHATSEERDFSSWERRQRKVRSSEERGSEHRDSDSRQPTRNGSLLRSRDRGDSRRGSQTIPRSSVSRNASFTRRYPEASDHTDGSRYGSMSRRYGRRVSGNNDFDRRHRRRTSSVNSSASDAGSPGAAPSHTSNRSVFLHATTVADIPAASPGPEDIAPVDGEELPLRERRDVHRSFSMRSPFRLQHRDEKRINYDNHDGRATSNGRPPQAPRTRRDSRDTEQEDRGSRYNSLPRGGSKSRHRRAIDTPTR